MRTLCSRSLTGGMPVSYAIKILVVHRLSSRQPLGVIVAEKLVKKVDRLSRDEMRIFGMNEALPAFARVSAIIQT